MNRIRSAAGVVAAWLTGHRAALTSCVGLLATFLAAIACGNYCAAATALISALGLFGLRAEVKPPAAAAGFPRIADPGDPPTPPKAG